MIDKLTSFSDALTLPIVEFVVLQAKRASIDFLEDGKQKLMLLYALLKVLHRWIVGNELVITHVPLLKLLIILHSLNELLRFLLNRGVILVACPLEQALKLIILLPRERFILHPVSFVLRVLQSLGEAFLDGNLHQVFLRFLLDCICKEKHCRQLLRLVLHVDHVGDLREVLRILINLVDRLRAAFLKLVMRLVHR